MRGGTEGLWVLAGILSAGALLLVSSCGVTSLDQSATAEALRKHDSRLAGLWIDFDSTCLDPVRQHVVFQTDPDSFLWSSASRLNNDTIDPTYSEMYYMNGTWRISNDTLFLSYDSHTIIWDYANNHALDTTVSTKSRETIFYYINDAGQLAISQDFSSWHYFHKGKPLPMPAVDTTIFTAQAPADTMVSALDTVRLVAGFHSASAPVIGYLWSFDGGKTYPETTAIGEIRLRWGVSKPGLYIGVVRAVDSNGIKSVPDYFEINVIAFRPVFSLSDSMLLCDDTNRIIRVAAANNSAPVAMYYGFENSSTVVDSNAGGLLPIRSGCLSKCVLSVFARDYHGLYSDTSRFTVRIEPTKTYGSSKDEMGKAVVCQGQSAIVMGSVVTGVMYEQLAYVFSIDSNGRKQREAFSYAGNYKGAYGINYGESMICRPTGGFLIAGIVDDSYQTCDSGFVICLDDSLRTLWSRCYKDKSCIGAGLTDIACMPAGKYALAGFSVFDSSYSIDTQTTGGYYYQKPYMACVDQNGGLLWQHTYPYQTQYGGKIAASSAGDIVFVIDSIVIKTDAEGNRQWTLLLPFCTADVVFLTAGDILVLCSDFAGMQVTLIWISALGQIIKTQPVPSIISPKGMIILSDNTLLLVSNQTVMRLSSDGSSIWQKSFDLFQIESAAQAFDNTIVITGFTLNYGAGKDDVILLKLDKDGKRIW